MTLLWAQSNELSSYIIKKKYLVCSIMEDSMGIWRTKVSHKDTHLKATFPTWHGIWMLEYKPSASWVVLVVKNWPANAGDVRDLGSIPVLEDPLQKGMATHSSVLARRIPWTEEPGGLQSIGWQRAGHGWSGLAQHSVKWGSVSPALFFLKIA